MKRVLWNRINIKRSGWERKFWLQFRAVLNRQYRKLADRIDSTNIGSDSVLSVIEEKDIEKAFIDLYKTVGVSFARGQYNQLKEMAGEVLKKEDEFVDDWYNYMQSYVRTKGGNRIVSIAKETRERAKRIIRAVIEKSTDEGWGADEVARQIRKSLLADGQEINKWRALRIARTEIVTASNVGTHLGAVATGYPMEKYWIATYDSRTRDTHLTVEQQNPKAMDEGFRVGAYLMEIPGDPDAGPEETINCRCGIDYKIKIN